MNSPVRLLLSRLKGVRRNGGSGYMALCPAHGDRHPSLSISEGNDGRALLKCFAGCDTEAVVSALGLKMSDIMPPKEGLYEVRSRSRSVDATAKSAGGAQSSRGCTVAQYAEAKRLPEPFLRSLGLTDIVTSGVPAVRIPYFSSEGTEAAVQLRLALVKTVGGPDERFRWRTGSRPCLYGLNRLDAASKAGYVVIVEGASDCHTLWHHGEPAVGLPGASIWKDEWATALADIPVVYVVIEPDQGGEATLKWISKSAVRDRVRLVRSFGAGDPSALYLADPVRFAERWHAAKIEAKPWPRYEAERLAELRAADSLICGPLAQRPRILDEFAVAVEQAGVVGEGRTAKVLYLVVTSRLLDKPASVALKGPSSSGKSFTLDRVLAFFPPEAYYALSSMSERALAYSEEPLAHRMLVLYEAAGLGGDFATYLIRSLLSEGKIRYETVEKATRGGLRARLIEREGPTGLIVTTTAISLHPENETRLLSIPVKDTAEQTKNVLRALAHDGTRPELDMAPWHSLQRWIGSGRADVLVPFAHALAELIPPVAVRLRRDFGMLLFLIRAHALLHQATRKQDLEGRIVATLDDYATVRDLVGDLLTDGLETTVSPAIRETVESVTVLLIDREVGVSLAMLARRLKIDRSAASRRVRVAIERGYLRNLEDRKGRPARVILGDPLPDAVVILPEPEDLAKLIGEGGGPHPPQTHRTSALPPLLAPDDPCTVEAVGETYLPSPAPVAPDRKDHSEDSDGQDDWGRR